MFKIFVTYYTAIEYISEWWLKIRGVDPVWSWKDSK